MLIRLEDIDMVEKFVKPTHLGKGKAKGMKQKEKGPKYNRTEMEAQVVKDFVKILSFMREDLAVDICREFLKGKGFNIIIKAT